MAYDDVPLNEMHRFGPHTDELEALLGDDDSGADLAELAAVVHDVRAAYLTDQPLRRSDALAAFTDVRLDDNGDPLATAASNAHGSGPQTAGLPNREQRSRSRMLSALSTFVATATGKVVLGTAVAAASVGGLQAADVVDLPGLPVPATQEVAVDAGEPAGDEVDGQSTQETATEEPGGDAEAGDIGEGSDDAVGGQETAAAARAKQAQAAEFTAAKAEWDACVDAATAAHLEAEEPGPFDPEDTCGERPHPGDFGVTTAPGLANAADNQPDATERTRRGDAGRPTDTSGAPAASTGDDDLGSPSGDNDLDNDRDTDGDDASAPSGSGSGSGSRGASGVSAGRR